MSQNGKRIVSEKYFEKDPFLGPLTSNNNSVTCCLETEKQKPIHCTGMRTRPLLIPILAANLKPITLELILQTSNILRYPVAQLGEPGVLAVLLPLLLLGVPGARAEPHHPRLHHLHRLPAAGVRPHTPRADMDRPGRR